MKTLKFAVAVAMAASMQPAYSIEKPEGVSEEKIANFFANCAGVWDFNADIMSAGGKPAVAESLHNLGNGAQTAALWVLASRHALDTGKATTYGSWMDLVKPKRENGRLRLRALAEMEDYKTIKEESNACSDALGEQENILQLMRKDRVDKAQAAGKAP